MNVCGMEMKTEPNRSSWWHFMQIFMFSKFHIWSYTNVSITSGEPIYFHDGFVCWDAWGAPTVLMSILSWFI